MKKKARHDNNYRRCGVASEAYALLEAARRLSDLIADRVGKRLARPGAPLVEEIAERIMERLAEPDPLMNRREVGEYLRIGPTRLDELLTKKGLPHFRFGRRVLFRKSEVDAWLERYSKPSTQDTHDMADEAVQEVWEEVK